jgi:type I restriction enzyme, S subunit
MVEAMEIPKGFKKTDVGIIPNDWDFDEIQNLSEITTGAKNTQDRIPDGVYPFFVRSQTVERIGSYSFDGEAVLTAGDGVGTGKVFHYINGKFDFHQRVYKISDFCERLNGYYFFLYFSKNFYNRIMQMTAKSSVDSVRREMIAKMLIPLPTKAEQTAIATALNDADVLITELEKLIAKKKAIKQGAMQELLRPKEGWEVKKLGACLRSNPDYGINAAAVPYDEALPVYLRITDITEDGKYSRQNVVSVNNILSSNYYLEKDDLVFARTGASVGKTYLYDPKDGKLVFAGFLIRIRTNSEILIPEYFQFYAHTSLYWDWIRTNSTRTGQPGINGNEYSEQTITLPSKAEQTRIAQILSDMDAEIEKMEKKLDKYKMLKQGMMQNLLTGKIRLI